MIQESYHGLLLFSKWELRVKQFERFHLPLHFGCILMRIEKNEEGIFGIKQDRSYKLTTATIKKRLIYENEIWKKVFALNSIYCFVPRFLLVM